MELTRGLIALLVASFATCFAHPYGVKSGSAAGASAGAAAGAGAVSHSGGPDGGSGSGSFSGSISKSTSASFAAATSGSFSFSGSGAGPFAGLGPNPFNFPLNGGGCATGKCENGGNGNQFGLSSNGAGSISGAGSYASTGAPDFEKSPPCSGNCLNKEPPSCQGPNCNNPANSADNSESYDIPVFIDAKQDNEPSGKPCQKGNCKSSTNSASQDYPPKNNNDNKSPSPYGSQKQGNPSSNPSNNNNPPKPYNNAPSSIPPPADGCNSGKCIENSAVYPNSQEYNPKTPSDNALPCSKGNCRGNGVKNTQPSNPYDSPTYQTPNIPSPCVNGNCKFGPNKVPYQPTFNHQANSPSDDEPVYTGGFGGPSGILTPNEYSAPLPSNLHQPDNNHHALQSPQHSPNKPGNYNLQPNANSPNSGKPVPQNSGGTPFPTNKPLSHYNTPLNPHLPTDSPPKSGKSPNSYATEPKPSSPSPYDVPVKTPSNYNKSPKQNNNSPAHNKPTEAYNNDESTPVYHSPELAEPLSSPPINALPPPSLLLETPFETPSQTPDNDDLYSPNQPSSYNVPIIPNDDAYKPGPSPNSAVSPQPSTTKPVPSTTKPVTSTLAPKTPTNKPAACAFGGCDRPDEKIPTPSYPNSQRKTPKEPSIATSTINVQLSSNPIESPDDSPDFDVRYSASNCINGNCVQKSSSNQPNPCQNGNCPVNNPKIPSGPSLPPQSKLPSCNDGKCKGSDFPSSPSEDDYNPISTPGETQPKSPPGCSNGKCGGSIPNSPAAKPYSPDISPSNYFPQPSNPGCSNGKCGGIPSTPKSPSLNNYPTQPIPGCLNGQCRGGFPKYPMGESYTPDRGFPPAEKSNTPNFSPSDNYPQPSQSGCSNGQCGGSYPGSPTGIPNSSGSPALNNYPPQPIPGCSNGQCGGGFPNYPMGETYPHGSISPPAMKPTPNNYYPQPSNPGCSNGQCGGSYSGSPKVKPYTPGGPAVNSGKPYTPSSVSQPAGNPYTPNISPSNYPQPSKTGCGNGQCGESFPGSPTGKPNTSEGPALNNYPPQSIPVCANGQCGVSFPNIPMGVPYFPSSVSPPAENPYTPNISPSNHPQPSKPGCSSGQCGGSQGSSAGKPHTPGGPALNNYPQVSSPGCSNGKCDESSPDSPSSVAPNNYPQPAPSGCLHGKCNENFPGSPSECANGNCGQGSPGSPTNEQYNPQASPSGSGCTNGNCGPTKPCANGKCDQSPKAPNQPDYPVNSYSQDKPIYGGGFGGPSGLLKPNDYSAPLPPNPAQTSNPGPSPSTPDYIPNKPIHHSSQPSLPSPHPHDSQDQLKPQINDNGPQSAHPYAQREQPQHGANIPHFGAAGSISISGAGAYTGGFGGPPGYLKPFDDNKGTKPKQNGAPLNAEPNHSGSSPSYGSGAFSAAGSYSSSGPKIDGPESTGNPKKSGCDGGCPNAGGYGSSGSFGGSFGLAKGGFDALISGAAASAKNLAGALAGTGSSGGSGSHGLSGSFASSSAVASSGAYKGGYGR